MPLPIVCRHAFFYRNQKEDKFINQYMSALRAATLYCEFDNLDDYLLDRLVCGLKVLQLQHHLLAKTELTLKTALDEAHASELSNKSAAEIQQASSSAAVSKTASIHHEEIDSKQLLDEDKDIHRLKMQPDRPFTTDPAKTICLGCGGNHLRSICRFKNTSCLCCGKKGHLARVCRAAKPAIAPVPAAKMPNVKKPLYKTHRRKEGCFTIRKGSYPVKTTMGQASGIQKKKNCLSIKLEGPPCTMELNTGSAVSLMSWHNLKQLVPRLDRKQLKPCNLKLRDYQGRSIPILGISQFQVG
ncbi:hypothetical protein E2320_018416 [Naja naja]|nr:hypothetical protein E2320_018416 [Naja naja]